MEFRVIKLLVHPGDSVLDLGANMGFYTKPFSDLVGPTGRVFSFEPLPANLEILEHMVWKLHLSNVEVFRYAVSDTNDNVALEIPLWESGEENVYEAKVMRGRVDSKHRLVIAQARTIDSLFSTIPLKFTFMKCDIEGHEFHALRGSQFVIEQSRPACMIEVMGNADAPNSEARKTFELLQRWGYVAYCFDGARMTRQQKPPRGQEKGVDYFFLTQTHVELLLKNGISVVNTGA